MTIYFTADSHFGHTNIIKYCNRPFSDVAEMNAAIVGNWNSKVKPEDTVWHLGDVSWKNFGEAREIVSRLNGTKHLVLGNHDKIWRGTQAYELFQTVQDYKELSTSCGNNAYDLILCHYPLEEWNGYFHQSIHLYGHVHGTRGSNERRLDVGVDCHNFTPVSVEEVFSILNGRKNGKT